MNDNTNMAMKVCPWHNLVCVMDLVLGKAKQMSMSLVDLLMTTPTVIIFTVCQTVSIYI